MEWAIAGGALGLVALVYLAYEWWRSAGVRKDASLLRKAEQRALASQRLAAETKAKLIEVERLRFNETITLQAMLEGRDRDAFELGDDLEGARSRLQLGVGRRDRIPDRPP